jgi:hypothetical protein
MGGSELVASMTGLLPMPKIAVQTIETAPARRKARLSAFPHLCPVRFLEGYCDGFAEPAFYAWRRTIVARDRQAAESPRPEGKRLPLFLPVRVSPASVAALEIVLRDDRVVRVPAGFDAATLRQLLAVLDEAPPC